MREIGTMWQTGVLTGERRSFLLKKCVISGLFHALTGGGGLYFRGAGGGVWYSRGPGVRGLEINRPLLRPFLGREAAWVLLVDSLFVVVFPLLLCLRLHFLLGPSRRSTPKWAEERVITPAARESDP